MKMPITEEAYIIRNRYTFCWQRMSEFTEFKECYISPMR